MASHAHRRVRSVCPPLSEIHSVRILETHILHAASHSIEASRKRDDVEFTELAILGDDAILLHLNHGIVFDVDDIVLWPVNLLIEVLLQRRSLRSPRMRCLERSEYVALARITDALSRLLHPELVGFVVGLTIEEIVLVGCEPELETTLPTCQRTIYSINASR